jgi:hypothetical protein
VADLKHDLDHSLVAGLAAVPLKTVSSHRRREPVSVLDNTFPSICSISPILSKAY